MDQTAEEAYVSLCEMVINSSEEITTLNSNTLIYIYLFINHD